MTTNVRRPSRRTPPASEVTGPAPSRFWGVWAAVTGVVMFVSGLFLLTMYASLLLGYGTSPWGSINDTLSAVGNLLLAALVLYASRRAVRGLPSLVFVGFVVAASVAGAASSLLLVAGTLDFERSSTITVAATAVQMVWLLWIGRRFARDEDLPRDLVRLALLVPAALLTAGLLVGASLLVPAGDWTSMALLGPGAMLAVVTWLMWPFWLVLLGRHLLGRRVRRPGPTGIAEAAR